MYYTILYTCTCTEVLDLLDLPRAGRGRLLVVHHTVLLLCVPFLVKQAGDLLQTYALGLLEHEPDGR